MMLQLNPYIPVRTPKGDGEAIIVIDYGHMVNTVWVVRFESGKILDFYSDDIQVFGNPMDGKGWDIGPKDLQVAFDKANDVDTNGFQEFRVKLDQPRERIYDGTGSMDIKIPMPESNWVSWEDLVNDIVRIETGRHYLIKAKKRIPSPIEEVFTIPIMRFSKDNILRFHTPVNNKLFPRTFILDDYIFDIDSLTIVMNNEQKT